MVLALVCDRRILQDLNAAANRVEDAETLLDPRHLANFQACVTDVVENRIPCNFLEAGVWRGGMTIFMRATLSALGDKNRVGLGRGFL